MAGRVVMSRRRRLRRLCPSFAVDRPAAAIGDPESSRGKYGWATVTLDTVDWRSGAFI